MTAHDTHTETHAPAHDTHAHGGGHSASHVDSHGHLHHGGIEEFKSIVDRISNEVPTLESHLMGMYSPEVLDHVLGKDEHGAFNYQLLENDEKRVELAEAMLDKLAEQYVERHHANDHEMLEKIKHDPLFRDNILIGHYGFSKHELLSTMRQLGKNYTAVAHAGVVQNISKAKRKQYNSSAKSLLTEEDKHSLVDEINQYTGKTPDGQDWSFKHDATELETAADAFIAAKTGTLRYDEHKDKPYIEMGGGHHPAATLHPGQNN